MKIPYFPDMEKAFEQLGKDLLNDCMSIHKEVQDETETGQLLKKAYEEYYPWDKFSNLSLPTDLYSHEKLWYYSKLFTRSSAKHVKHLKDIKGQSFKFSLTDTVLKNLHHIDMHLSDNVAFQHKDIEEVQKEEWMKKRVISSLIDEAITSSQIEGAATTRTQAKAMIKSGKKPKTPDERMILNNYYGIRQITESLKDEALSPGLIKRIHKILVEELLDNPAEVGHFRQDEKEEEKVRIYDDDGTILFVPPHHSEISERVDKLCDFVNDEEDFYHPVIKAIVLHFMIGYIHPFVDGNGRTARGLFYWYLVRKGYRLFEYVSISEIIKKSIGQYKRAYLYAENDEGDLTYFIYYHLDVIGHCIKSLEKYIQKKIVQYDNLKRRIRRQEDLNLRQIDLLNHALRHKESVYTINGHLNSNKISWATARSDLLGLAEKGFLVKQKKGKELCFLVSDNMEELLMS